MKIFSEDIYDALSLRKCEIRYDDMGEIINMHCFIKKGNIPQCKLYKNKLYFFGNYREFDNRDFLWITDDNIVIDIDDEVLHLIANNDEFIDKLRDLKTGELINNYITFLKL